MACSGHQNLVSGRDFLKDITRKSRWLAYGTVDLATLFDAKRIMSQLATVFNELL